MKKITPFLWFNDKLDEAIAFYQTVFPDSKVHSVKRFPPGTPGNLEGKIMTARFELAGQELLAFEGGPEFKFNEAISLFVSCETQEEIDRLWTQLTSGGGEESQCGWLRDRFG